MLWRILGRGQLYFNQLAVECVQHCICDHVINCSSIESDRFQRSLVVSLLSGVVLACLGVIFVSKGFCGLDYSNCNFCIERFLWIGL